MFKFPNQNITKLLPKTWGFIILVAMIGFFVGKKINVINDPQLAGIFGFLYSLGIIWIGLVLGYQTKANEKQPK